VAARYDSSPRASGRHVAGTRPTWSIPLSEDDFIEWGFLQLAKAGDASVTLRGLDHDRDDFLGMGLSWTSEWTFSSGLDRHVLMEALGELTDRRPGGSLSSALD